MADALLSEVVAVFIELRSGEQSDGRRNDRVLPPHLASFKVPRRVQFVEEWPMTGAGKIQRYVLKELLAQTGP